MKPYPHHHNLTSPYQKHYNYQISRAQIALENAFGRLKARWHHLAKQNDMNIPMQLQPAVFYTTCVKFMVIV